MSEPAQYAAFLSYSHRDKRWADWFHRAIETYRPPGRLGERATLRARLRPIFRDRDELPASPDLSQQIDEALAASRALIVLCSPSAACSQWTNAEITRFKRLHPDRPILAVLVGGVPYASETAGNEHEEAFPPALRFHVSADGTLTDQRAEPIAADVRPEGDGKRLAKLKIIAGLLGVRLDELVQREAARRNRRLALTAGVLIIGMAFTSGLAAYAFHQRAEAVRQREQGDGLIQFMMTDLRRKLEPLGRLDVLDSVGEKALAYYASQNLADLDADALGQRASALQMVGKVASDRGSSERALALFDQAAKTTAEQLRRDPGNPQRIFDHAQSVFWVGNIAYQRGDIPTALDYFKQYRDLGRRLAKIATDKPAWQAEEGYADVNLGAIDLDAGRGNAALVHFEAARVVFERLSARHPDDAELAYWLGQSLGRKADSRRSLGDYPGAAAERRAELVVYQRIVAREPGNANAISGIGVVWMRLAQIQIDAGLPEKAIGFAEQSRAVMNELQRKDDTNRMYPEVAIKAAGKRTEALMMTGRWAEARQENAAALIASRRLVGADRTVTKWRTQCLMQARWMQIAIDRRLARGAVVRGEVEAFTRDFPEQPKIADAAELFARTMVLVISGLDHRSRGEDGAADADLTHAVQLFQPGLIVFDARLDAVARAVHKLVPSAPMPMLANHQQTGNYLIEPLLSIREEDRLSD